MSSAAALPAEAEVLQEQTGPLAILTLNRPKALNALTTGMVEDLYKTLKYYQNKPSITAILIRGAGGKAFCAGGDVKAVVQMSQAGKIEEAMRFFRSEYHLNYKIATLKEPYIALLDGITMGGGVGVSIHGTFRIATERTLFAMPECAIGLIPDVGGSYFLPRLDNSFGLYIALTGCRLKGIDMLHAGLATHYIPSTLLPKLQNAILNTLETTTSTAVESKNQLETSLRSVLNEFQSRTPLPTGELLQHTETISRVFGGNNKSVEEIYEACMAPESGDFGKVTAELMSRGSPTSQRIVVEQLHRGASMPLNECLKMEYRLVHHLVSKNESDFHEGVTATLITRSGAPVWRPSTLKQVPAETILEMFDWLPAEQELQLEAIGRQKTLERGALKDDQNKSQQQLRKLLQRYNSKVPIEQIRYEDKQAGTFRRRLAQFIDNKSPGTEKDSPDTSANAAGSQNGTPGPAPGPQAEFSPVPPPVNPFVPPSDNSSRICCCRTTTFFYEEPYQEPTPPYCCCGSRSSCCPQGSLIKIICGGGQVCGILMLLSALIAVIIVAICLSGSFYARRRRNQLLAMQAAGDGPNGAIVGGGGPTRPADQITINDAEIPGLRVKYGSECTHIAHSTEEEGGGVEAGTTIEHGIGNVISTTLGSAPGSNATPGTKECPICLDTVSLYSNTWAVFPCTHGCCKTCFTDLLRHSSRRVNNDSAVWAIMCPLCRKMAVAPEGEIPPLPSRRSRRSASSEGNDAPSSPSTVEREAAAAPVESSEQQAQQPSSTAAAAAASPPQP